MLQGIEISVLCVYPMDLTYQIPKICIHEERDNGFLPFSYFPSISYLHYIFCLFTHEKYDALWDNIKFYRERYFPVIKSTSLCLAYLTRTYTAFHTVQFLFHMDTLQLTNTDLETYTKTHSAHIYRAFSFEGDCVNVCER